MAAKAKEPSVLYFLTWLLAPLTVLGTVFLFVNYGETISDKLQKPEIILPILLVLGVIALIGVLAFITQIFNFLNLTDPKEPLGLPVGSIRAVIALSLILIFMISALLLYEDVSSRSVYESTNITEKQLANIPADEITYIHRELNVSSDNETLYDVGRAAGNVESVDLAKQIITTVSTLVVAVAGFYFGSNAVSAATKAVSKVPGESKAEEPLVRAVNIQSGKRGEKKDLIITGKNLKSVDVVKIVLDKISIECSDIIRGDTKIMCTLTIPPEPKKAPSGNYDLVVVDDAQNEDRLDGIFTVKEDAVSTAGPSIENVNPNSGTQGEKRDITITGKNLKSVNSVKIVSGATSIVCRDITPTDTTVTCKLEIPPNAPKGIYELVVANDAHEEGHSKDVFTIKEALNNAV